MDEHSEPCPNGSRATTAIAPHVGPARHEIAVSWRRGRSAQCATAAPAGIAATPPPAADRARWKAIRNAAGTWAARPASETPARRRNRQRPPPARTRRSVGPRPRLRRLSACGVRGTGQRPPRPAARTGNAEQPLRGQRQQGSRDGAGSARAALRGGALSLSTGPSRTGSRDQFRCVRCGPGPSSPPTAIDRTIGPCNAPQTTNARTSRRTAIQRCANSQTP